MVWRGESINNIFNDRFIVPIPFSSDDLSDEEIERSNYFTERTSMNYSL